MNADVKLFGATFVAVFLAEMGDKTQIATLMLASGNASRLTVFLASALALVATSAIAVMVGEAASRLVPPRWIQRAAGLVFVIIGIVFLVRSLGGKEAS